MDNQKEQSKHQHAIKNVVKDAIAITLSMASAYGMCLACLQVVDGANRFRAVCIVLAFSALTAVIVILFAMMLSMETD